MKYQKECQEGRDPKDTLTTEGIHVGILVKVARIKGINEGMVHMEKEMRCAGREWEEEGLGELGVLDHVQEDLDVF